jgi:two-component system sensor histidine kinase CiaH
MQTYFDGLQGGRLMFKKLRNKFLILNLVIISVLMLFSFTAIYLITYSDVRSEIEMELRKLSDSTRKQNENLNPSKPNFQELNPPQDRYSFTIITDMDWNRIQVSYANTLTDDFLEAAKNVVKENNTNRGNFKLDDINWTYIVKPHLNGYKIVCLDITSQHNFLSSLIYTFLIVALVMLIVIFFISSFFADKSIQPIKEAFDKQKQFIGDASHELKTPLAVINTNVDVLLANGEDSINNQSKWLHYIKSEAERMNKLTSDLLYLAQMDYSDAKMIFSNLNLSETVESVILTMEAVIFESNINFDYDIEPDVTTYGNTEQLKQIVMILLDNAVKYTNTKGSINVSLKRNYNNILLSVKNTGEGIPDEHLPKIFDRFYRTDKSRARKSGGYGLGLAIAKAIVEQHKGKIWAKSVPNESTTFFVELPSAN